MFSRFLKALAVATLACAASAHAAELRVCADPDSLPYSHASQSGFENRIAALLAGELGKALVYVWHPQQRGFVRKTMGASLCDVWMGVPRDFERVLTTRPYYRSSYVFLSRGEAPLASFQDPRITRLRIGIEVPGDDGAATPAGHALALRGAKVVGFSLYGHAPAAQRIVEAIAKGELDAAVVWGPAAGFFATRANLHLHPASDAIAGVPFEFSISVGVRRGEKALRDAIDAAIERRAADIGAILDEYRVPRL